MKIKLLITALLCSFFAVGQISLVNDGFGAANSNPLVRTGWTTNAASGANWEIRTTGPSSGYSWTNPAASASGTGNVFTNLGTNTNTKTITYDNSLSTVGYTSIVVRFGGMKSGTVPNVDISYSTDGISFTPVSSLALATASLIAC